MRGGRVPKGTRRATAFNQDLRYSEGKWTRPDRRKASELMTNDAF
jgi:hypothetical protein